jgi:hypothetical protein
VIDGQGGVVGSDVSAPRAAVERAKAEPHGIIDLRVESDGNQTMTAFAALTRLPEGVAADHVEIVIAVTEDHLKSDVTNGENKGRTLTHAAVVRELKSAGTGQLPAKTTFKLGRDWKYADVHVVGFAQDKATKRVIATAIVPL